jgi:putative oxygen-independent coproporphyrinogen III oxidase
MTQPLAVYVHLPWCVRKCPYCDFNSHAAPADLPEEAYVSALLADLAADLELASGREVGSVFLGGGTPSLFSAGAIGRILDGVASALSLRADAEVTLEANPGTMERGHFGEYASAGVNRVSLGAQSFSAPQLQALGRIHAASDTEAAVRDLERAGIHNFNLDLMYALPGQDVEGAVADLRSALSLGPAHLSHYQLTLEEGTPFFHRPPALPDDDAALEMQVACQAELAAAGFRQYEISAYAREGRRCRHNLTYWTFGDYLGLGAGAHGKLTAADGTIWRTEKPRMPREYMSKAGRPAAGTRRCVGREELPFEWALNVLRLVDGATLASFEAVTGLPSQVLSPAIDALRARGLVDSSAGRVRATPLGLRFLNDVQAAFLPERAA